MLNGAFPMGTNPVVRVLFAYKRYEMNGKHMRKDQTVEWDAAQRRHAAAVETRRNLQGLPQFQIEEDLPQRLRQLLTQLEQHERRAR